MKTRIYIVDDHALFRKGLATIIAAEPDMEVCGEGDDCAVATQAILRLKPDLVIADITLRGNNGIELIKNVKAAEPQIQIMVVSQHDESVYALRVLRVGARAYVMKQDAIGTVVEAIRAIRKGQLYVSEFVASQMLTKYAQGEELGDDSPVANLSDRELEVLNLLGSGVSTRDIASRLHVSVKTVETHRAHIKAKLNLGTASQLIQFCVRWVDRSEHVVRRESSPPMAVSPPTDDAEAPPHQEEPKSEASLPEAPAPDASPPASAEPEATAGRPARVAEKAAKRQPVVASAPAGRNAGNRKRAMTAAR